MARRGRRISVSGIETIELADPRANIPDVRPQDILPATGILPAIGGPAVIPGSQPWELRPPGSGGWQKPAGTHPSQPGWIGDPPGWSYPSVPRIDVDYVPQTSAAPPMQYDNQSGHTGLHPSFLNETFSDKLESYLNNHLDPRSEAMNGN